MSRYRAYVLDENNRDDHDDGDGDHREAENLTGAIQFPLQRCRFVRGLPQKAGNPRNIGLNGLGLGRLRCATIDKHFMSRAATRNCS